MLFLTPNYNLKHLNSFSFKYCFLNKCGWIAADGKSEQGDAENESDLAGVLKSGVWPSHPPSWQQEDKEPVVKQKQKSYSDSVAVGAAGLFVFSLAEIRSLLHLWRQEKRLEQLEDIQR